MHTKVLVLGTGSAGLRHAKNAKALGCEVALFSSRGQKSDLFPTFVQSLEKVGKEFRPNAVIIASETAQHLAQFEAVQNWGAKILIEKPLGLDSASSRSAFGKLNANARVGFLFRYHPAVVKLREQLPRLGRLIHAKFHFASFLPDWRKDRDYHESYSASLSRGGGVMLDSAHEFDLIQFLLGGVDQVSGFSGQVGDLGIESDDICQAHLLMKSGARVELHLSYLDRISSRGICVTGIHGSATVDLVEQAITIQVGGAEVETTKWEFERNQLFLDEISDFLANGESCRLPGVKESLELLSTIATIRKASEERRWVRVSVV